MNPLFRLLKFYESVLISLVYTTKHPTTRELWSDFGRTPGARDIDRVKNLLQSTAQLEFWETESKDKLTSFLFQANEF